MYIKLVKNPVRYRRKDYLEWGAIWSVDFNKPLKVISRDEPYYRCVPPENYGSDYVAFRIEDFMPVVSDKKLEDYL